MIMELSEIKELMKTFDESQSVFFELTQESFHLKLKKEAAVNRPDSAGRVETVILPGQEIKPGNAASSISEEPGEQAEANEAPETVSGETVKAPLVGVFYAAPSPEDPAFVQVGDTVKKGQTLCLIEAMKMMNELKSPRDGVIKKIFVKNQDVVGYDDLLFLIGEA